MELNEPSTDLREIHGVANVTEYLRNMDLSRKLFGGCDYQEVWDHFAEVTQRYNRILRSLLPMRKQAMEAFELQDRLERMSREYEALSRHCDELRQWSTYQQEENNQLKQEAAALYFALVQRGGV